MRFPLLLFVCLVMIAGAARAADSTSTGDREIRGDSAIGTVGAIRIIGNRRTNEETILHEITFAVGDSLTHNAANESQQRVYNLGLFNSTEVTLIPDSAHRSFTVYIIVSERWYIWPQVILGVKDRDLAHIFSHGSKVYAGLGVLHYNVRGRREKLFVGGALGYDPWASAEYSFLALDDARRVLLDASLGTSRTLNQSDTLYTGGIGFNEIRYNAAAQISYRVTPRLNVGVRAEIQTLHLSNPAARLTLDPSGDDLSPTLALTATYDSRDDAEYPTAGSWMTATISKTGAGQYVNFGRVLWDLRRYQQTVGGVALCVRAAANLAYGGNIPVYNHMYLGLTERVRGEFSVKREGEDFALGAFEARIPLFMQRTVAWSSAPTWFPAEFSSGHIALYATIFADAGAVWMRGESINAQRWSNGVGAGLNLLGPYGMVFRTEYALHGDISHGEWIFEFDASF